MREASFTYIQRERLVENRGRVGAHGPLIAEGLYHSGNQACKGRELDLWVKREGGKRGRMTTEARRKESNEN